MDWDQLRTILWLRWHLTRNQWSRSGQLGAALTMIVVGICLVIGVAGGLVGVLAGAFALAKKSPQGMLIVWDIIICSLVYFWMIGIVSEIQRSETIDIGRLLHLPISLRDIFLLNYLASHFTFSIILFLPAMMGLCLGLILAGRWLMILMVPMVLGVVFMITAWSYCLRGWLAALMVNKRRRRAIIAGITFSFILITQLPNIFGNLMRGHKRREPETAKSAQSDVRTTNRSGKPNWESMTDKILVAHKVIPILWVGNGAMSLARGNALPAVLSAIGAFGIGGLGLRRAYRSSLRFYMGQATGRAAKQKPKTEKISSARKNFLEKRLPWIHDEAAALALAFFRSLSRAPEVKMALATNFIMLLFFGMMIFARRMSDPSDNFKPLIASGVIMFTFLGMSYIMFNQFGYDRGGFRQLVLLPVPRRQILLGKNLALLPVAFIFGSTALVLVKIAFHISLTIILAAALQLIVAFILLSIVGNLISILVPYRIAPGSMRRTKTSTMTTLLIFVTRLSFPVVMIPILLPPAIGLLTSRLGWPRAGLINLVLSIVLLPLLLFCYRLSLPGLGKLLLRREKQILQVVTEKVE